MLRMLLTPRWLARHVLALALVAVCVVAARWQLHRALTRHSLLNWSYVVEWSLFASFVVLCWAWFLRDDARYGGDQPQPEPAPVVLRPQRVALEPPVTDDEDPELAAYNRYLAGLSRSGPDR